MKGYVKTPTVLQMEMTECGAASLAMVLAYYGCYIPLEQMRIETAVSRDGVTAANIMRAAKRLGLNCRGFRKEPDKLKAFKMPCIIHWNFNHFVVLEGFKGKYAYLNDPAYGRRKITLEEFDEGFTGVVLTFEKGETFKKTKKQNRTLPFIASRVKTQIPVIVKLIYIGVLLVFPGLILPVLSQVFIDDILLAGYTSWLTKLLVFMGGCLLFKAGLSYYRSMILEKLKNKMSLLSGYKFLSHMLLLPISFFSQRYAGDLVSRIDNNTEIDEFLAGDLAETALNLLTALFYLAVLFFYNVKLTLIGLAGVSVSLAVAIYSSKISANAVIKLQMNSGKLYGALCAGLSITDTIKASGVESEYGNRLIGHQAVFATQEQKLGRFQQILSAIPQTINQIIDVLILMVGAYSVIRGQLTVGMLIAFGSLLDSFVEPVSGIIGFFDKLQTMKSNINRVNDIELYGEDPTLTTGNKEEIIHKLSGTIELKNVSFGYAVQSPPVVSEFSFTLRSGESIAFVGPSGCGKSTISKIISGLYHHWEGEVLFDGMPIESIPATVLHASIATVSQNILLFSGTIRDNLTLWNRAIREEDMVQAAKDACIHDFIMQLPGGYNYILSENADNLSGGQRQRIEIARALTQNPSILVMDEATSALDPVVEKDIMDNIQKRGCTCVIVAHRLSAIRDSNQIVVMSRGKIIQQGTHEQLRSEEGFYRNFYKES